ncbi:MAG: peptidylprolyl isomerase [Betaproteobacteria bacterium HGW-Betaproteobacteria-11]|nr:MAG: peptidylprolyl isomerase [Betaproteobacteria bacterium HGW-Betaproteobacteria-11]
MNPAPNPAPSATDATVAADSLLTLHYCVATADGEELVSTFGHTPAVVQLGSGELAPPFEHCLIGLPPGARQSFTLAADEAFGPRQPELLRRVARRVLAADAILELHGRIAFTAPNGQPLHGIVREIDADAVLLDFNHPLAGQTLRFEAEIVGIL